MINDFLRLMVSLSLSGGALTLLAALLNQILRGKMPRTFLYYLWLLVLARFLLPIGADWSLLNRLMSPSELTQKTESLSPIINTPQIAPSMPAMDISAASHQIQTSETPHLFIESEQKEIMSWTPSLSLILAVVWGIGVLFCITWRLYEYRCLKQDLRQNLQPVWPWERKLLCDHTKGMRVRPALQRSIAAESPLLVGLLHPVIWLPRKKMNGLDLSHALRHELTHWRRRDLWLKWIAVLTACLHWFNPAAWYLIHVINRDCELSCDEQVVKGLSWLERASYGELLLHYAASNNSPTSSSFASLGNQKQMLKERLQIIMQKNKYGKKTRFLLAAAVAVIILSSTILGTYAFHTESEPSISEPSSPNVPEQAAKDDNAETDTMKVLTPEAIEMLSAKQKSLRIEDFAPYMDLTPLQEKGSLRETLAFSYNGETMYLRVIASDKDLVAAPYEGDLDGATIFHKEFLELDTMEQEYAYRGSCADIRSGNLENILNGTVDMSDYMTVALPDGLMQSDFKYWMGSHGGATFFKDGQTEEITLENAGIYAANPLPGGIEIWGNGELGQNLETVREFAPLNMGDIVIRRKVLQTEQGTRWFTACTERVGSSISYCFYLNESEYTEDEFLTASETIKLAENAIY